VDYVQWTGLSEGPDPNQWETPEYEYDPSGRRIKKKVNGYAIRYLYDGDHVIAEYDGNHNLVRKFVYGPGVDQPVCMIDVVDSNEPYYYHFDGLGSVMALSDANNIVAERYAYDAFGQPALSRKHPAWWMPSSIPAIALKYWSSCSFILCLFRLIKGI